MDSIIIDALKQFEWESIITKGNKLEDLNDRQWRFIKGLVAELIVEKHSGSNGLKYVGENHKDYEWQIFNLSVELKSQLSCSMYGKKGATCKNFTIDLNNSRGTNKKDKLDCNEVADILIVIRNDGAFALDKETVIKHSIKTGDGFDVRVSKNDIIELTGKIVVNNTNSLNLKERITDAIREVI